MSRTEADPVSIVSPVLRRVADAATLRPQGTPLADPLGDMRERLRRTGQWQPHQTAGRRWPVACVSLEITQRCNLDCTLCYLSVLAPTEN